MKDVNLIKVTPIVAGNDEKNAYVKGTDSPDLSIQYFHKNFFNYFV